MTDDEERRHFRDMLIEVHTMLKGHIDLFNVHVDLTREHFRDDKEHFGRLYGMVGKLKWYVGVGMGIVLALEFAAKFLKAQ